MCLAKKKMQFRRIWGLVACVCIYRDKYTYIYVNEKRKRNYHFEGEVEGLFKLLPRAL